MLGSIRIEDLKDEDASGDCRIVEGDTYLGLFNYSTRTKHGRLIVNKSFLSRIFRTIVISKHPLHRTRLFRIVTGKLRLDLYNYCSGFSFCKGELIYGVHILFLRLKWARY